MMFALLMTMLFVGQPIAQANDPGFRFQISDKLMAGEQPWLVLMPLHDAKKVRLTLVGPGGKKIVKKAKRIAAGQEHRFSWKQGAGKFHYKATLEAQLRGKGKQTSQFAFDVVVVRPPKISVDKSMDRLADHQIRFSADRPLAKAVVEITDKNGDIARRKEVSLGKHPARSPVVVHWEPFDAEILTISLKAYDEHGFWSGVELTPYWVDIPHDDVEFSSGKWDILPEQRPKLDSALELIFLEMEKVKKARGDFEFRLYVAGYTDTVGSAADNLVLSKRRARAIATYFRRNRLAIPMYFQGFGEGALYVTTPDNTDEPRNRRALYVLANAPPPRSPILPRSDWKRLP